MKVKNIIRNSFLGNLLINYLHEVEGYFLPLFISDEKAVKRYCKKIFGRQIDLDNPVLFYEKLNWYKLNGKKPLMKICANKYTLRQYVEKLGYSDNLNELYAVYNNVDEIDINALPKQFVLKASHGTHMQIIVKDKEKVNWNQSRKLMKSWLRQNIYWRGREWVYKDMPHHIIAEKYLEDASGELRDYKIFCFNGKPMFVQVDIGRFTKHKRNYYDIKWKLIPMTDYVGNAPKLNIKQPESFYKMLEIAEKLSAPFQFVRVDFYEVKGKPYIGEMTFFHEGGSIVMIPDEWNKKIGDFWTLVK